MDRFVLYLRLETYLAEWFVHENGGENPIGLPRGSSESDILEYFLRKAPEERTGEITAEEANVVILLPFFKNKDPRTYNYLPPKARKMLEHNIYVRFRVQMWEQLRPLYEKGVNISDMIYAWMEQHGISDTPQNWETIRQMFYRKRKVHEKARAQKQDENEEK